jgi:RNA polymerase sigma-70 factor (family 1)
MTRYDSHPEEQLLYLLKTGDQAAFAALYHRYWDRLFYIGGRLTGNLAVAEEIVQDIFLDLWQRREDLEIRDNLEHYLVVATRYRVLTWQARQARSEAWLREAAHRSEAGDSSTEEGLRYAELKAWLEGLVSKMPEKCRLVYRLREEGFSHREIADRMQISEKTVENHVTRALRLLRAGLSELFTLFFTLAWVVVRCFF